MPCRLLSQLFLCCFSQLQTVAASPCDMQATLMNGLSHCFFDSVGSNLPTCIQSLPTRLTAGQIPASRLAKLLRNAWSFVSRAMCRPPISENDFTLPTITMTVFFGCAPNAKPASNNTLGAPALAAYLLSTVHQVLRIGL
jgi:hypothetical protein